MAVFTAAYGVAPADSASASPDGRRQDREKKKYQNIVMLTRSLLGGLIGINLIDKIFRFMQRRETDPQ